MRATARGLLQLTLTGVYYALSAGGVFGGGALCWAGIDSGGAIRILGGLALVAFGILVFIRFPGWMRRKTGREPLGGGAYGAYAGGASGSGSCGGDGGGGASGC